MRTLLAAVSATTSIVTVLLRLPDIPGQVVEVRRLMFNLTSHSAFTGLATAFHHNVNLNVTLSVGDFTSQWARMNLGVGLIEGAQPMHIPFDPPYDLVGVQRWDTQLSSGTAEATLMVNYTVRMERNKTIWNELRARTSFEGD